MNFLFISYLFFIIYSSSFFFFPLLSSSFLFYHLLIFLFFIYPHSLPYISILISSLLHLTQSQIKKGVYYRLGVYNKNGTILSPFQLYLLLGHIVSNRNSLKGSISDAEVFAFCFMLLLLLLLLLLLSSPLNLIISATLSTSHYTFAGEYRCTHHTRSK
jgi:hypothetical protein